MDEGTRLLKSALVSILDDDIAFPCWSIEGTSYYNKLAKNIQEENPELHALFLQFVTLVRAKYRSHTEYLYRIAEVPMERCLDPAVEAALRDDCCCCLKPLGNSHMKLVRLKPLLAEPTICGHFLHLECALKLLPTQQGTVQCPLCRCDVGPVPLGFWIDTERSTPQH